MEQQQHHYYYNHPQSFPQQQQHHYENTVVNTQSTSESSSNCCHHSSNYHYQQHHIQQQHHHFHQKSDNDNIEEYLSNSDDDQADDNQSSDLSVTPPQTHTIMGDSSVASSPTAAAYYHHPHHPASYVVISNSSNSSSPVHTPHFINQSTVAAPPGVVVPPLYTAAAAATAAYYIPAGYSSPATSDVEVLTPRSNYSTPASTPTSNSYVTIAGGMHTPPLPQYHLYHQHAQQQPTSLHQLPHSNFHQVIYPSSPLEYQITPPLTNSSPPSTPPTPCPFLNNNEPSTLTTLDNPQSPNNNNIKSPSQSTKTNKVNNKKRSRSEKQVVTSSVQIDPKLQLEINNFFTNYNVSLNNEQQQQKPISIPLLISMSEIQKNLYRDLLRNNIPKISHSQNENEKISFLHGLYLMLMNCVNHPYQFAGIEPTNKKAAPNDHLIQCSGKLMVLDKVLEAMNQSQVTPSRLFILSSSQPMLKILEDYFKLKSLNFIKPGSSNDTEDDDETQIILSNFLESSIYSPFKADDLVIEFDYYWQAESSSNSITSELSDSSLPSCGSANDHRSICPSFVLLAIDSVEEWSHQQRQNKSSSSSAISKKDSMIEMMKFCIVKMSQTNNNANQSSPVDKSNINNNNTTSPSTTSPQTTSPTNSTAPSTPPGSELNTPILASPSNSSSSLTSIISDSPAILSFYSQINKDTVNQDLWKTNSKTNTPFHFTFVSSEHNPVDPKSTDFQIDKKRRNPKRQKNLCDRSCFLCKKEEDPKGRTSIVQCRSCPKIYHRSCAGLAHTPRSWKCPRHSCHSCRKTPNESGGSFFICKECPNSFCITCLPNDITILQKHEYSESKHDNEIPIAPPAPSIESSNDDLPSSAANNKKPKTPRPTVYIQCGKCNRKLANCPSNSISSPALLATSTPIATTPNYVSTNHQLKISVCDSSSSSPELNTQIKDPDTPTSLYLSDPETLTPSS